MSDEPMMRPTVRVDGCNLADLTSEVLDHLRRANEPPTLFAGPKGLLRVRGEPGELRIERLDRAAVALVIAAAVDTVNASGEIVTPPRSVVAAVMSPHVETGLPILREVRRDDGRSFWDPTKVSGYDRETGVWWDCVDWDGRHWDERTVR